MRLTIRDLFWLILLTAGLTAWRLEHREKTGLLAERGRETLLYLAANPPNTAGSTAQERRQLAARYVRFGNAELDVHLGKLLPHQPFQDQVEYEVCLQEMARRSLREPLEQRYADLVHRRQQQSPTLANLELLTALRRTQTLPEPLCIQIEVAPSDVAADKLPRPILRATVTNEDVKHETIQFKSGGDYRGGRNARWRFQLTDGRGRVVPDSDFRPQEEGGVFGFGPLRNGASDDHTYEFDLRTYIALPSSGHYRLQAFYHNESCIADDSDLTGMVVARSQPIAVVVHNPADAVISTRMIAPCSILAGAGVLLTLSAWRARRAHWRDWLWFALLAAISVGFWLDQQHLVRELANALPDESTEWSIHKAA